MEPIWDQPAFAVTGSDILALIGDGIVSTNERGEILLFSPAAQSMFGYTRSEVAGKPIKMLIPARLRGRHAAELGAFAAGEGGSERIMGHRREVLGLRKNGEEFPVDATVSRRCLGERTIMTVMIRDASERKRFEQALEARNRALAASENRLRLALEAARLGSREWLLASDILEADPTTRQLWGLPATEALTADDALKQFAPLDPAGAKARLRTAIAERHYHESQDRIVGPDDRVRWVAVRAQMLPGPDGTPERIIGVTFDVTHQQEMEEQRRLMFGELKHRMKNMMALVQSVVSLSSRQADSVELYSHALHGRLGAIAGAQTRLFDDESSGGLNLLEQLSSQLAPYRNHQGTNVTLVGPDIVFEEKAGLPIALALHELATNAAKYGALSVATGRLDVRWVVDEETVGGRLVLEWLERGGPPVASPSRKGFGTKLLETLLIRSLQGEVAMNYAAEGLSCRISVPLRAGTIIA